MEDIQIVDLYWQRSGLAIPETNLKYGIYCCHSGYHGNGYWASRNNSKQNERTRRTGACLPLREGGLRFISGEILRIVQLTTVVWRAILKLLELQL